MSLMSFFIVKANNFVDRFVEGFLFLRHSASMPNASIQEVPHLRPIRKYRASARLRRSVFSATLRLTAPIPNGLARNGEAPSALVRYVIPPTKARQSGHSARNVVALQNPEALNTWILRRLNNNAQDNFRIKSVHEIIDFYNSRKFLINKKARH